MVAPSVRAVLSQKQDKNVEEERRPLSLPSSPQVQSQVEVLVRKNKWQKYIRDKFRWVDWSFEEKYISVNISAHSVKPSSCTVLRSVKPSSCTVLRSVKSSFWARPSKSEHLQTSELQSEEKWELQEEHETHKELFKEVDTDRSGFVTLKQVKECAEVNAVLKESEITQLFHTCDFGAKKMLNSECFTLL